MINLNIKIKNLTNDPWVLGNSVLYKLCKDYPFHKTDEEIAAKIWLIGRAYAASVERRKNKTDINDDFYSEIVIPKMKKSNIDKWICDCKDKKTKELCLLAHKNVTDLFKDISGLEKRSLASKYLHFHLPDIFFIFDSRAANGINKLFGELDLEGLKVDVDEDKADKNYAQFYNKCLKAQGEIKKQYNIWLNCRQLDTLLVNIANENLRK